jgi:dihydropyrimidinase
LPVILDHILQKKSKLSILDFVRITSTTPAKIYGLFPKKGQINIGSDADIVIWDTNKNMLLSDSMVVDGSKYNPYKDFKVTCWPKEVILRGNTIVEDNDLKADQGTGKFIPTALSEYI